MYQVRVKTDLSASHYLTNVKTGPESRSHSHQYELEVILSGSTLDESGYLMDIDAVKASLEEVVRDYGAQLLNELPQFRGKNPSVENFCHVIWNDLARTAPAGVQEIDVRLWEDPIAWASYSAPVQRSS